MVSGQQRTTRGFAPVAGAAMVLVGLAMPFARTGTLTRDAFGLSDSLRSSGLAGRAPVHLAALGVDLVPALAALALVLGACATRQPVLFAGAALASAVIGALGLAVGLAVLVEPALGAAPGALLSACAGALTLLLVVRSATTPGRWRPRSRRSPLEGSTGP